MALTQTGGCYCGALRYEVTQPAVFKAQCHCRACQYFAGGGPNYFMLVPQAGFSWIEGTPATFTRSDLEKPVTREFCATCGTQMVTRLIGQPVAVVKVGTLDEPASYGGPMAAIHMADAQPFHHIAAGIAQFDKLPPRA